MTSRSLTIIGGGIVGLATAREALRRRPGLVLTLVEKECDVGLHQSTHNSGVLHCGLAYRPGSLKARLATRGIRQMVDYCRHHDIPHEICGKLVVATSDDDVPRLRALAEQGAANGLEGLRWLSPPEMRRREPHVGGVAGLEVPQEGIVDYERVCQRLADDVRDAGGRILLGQRVEALHRSHERWQVQTPDTEIESHRLINCAGLHSDRVATLGGLRRPLRIVPFRGEYHRLRTDRGGLVRHLIYPTPDPAMPFLGVHFTRNVTGGIECGPNAVFAFSREGYRFRDVDLRDLVDSLGYPGLWRFLGRHRAMVTGEIAQSLSRERFCRSLQRLVPDIRPQDLEAGGAGVRAQAMAPDGQLVHDFRLLHDQGALHVLNAPSPAATASLAIASTILDELDS